MVEKVKGDWRAAGLDPETCALLEFAEKLTLDPRQVAQADLEALRASGFGDAEIIDATLIVCLFNFMNRLTHALGLSGEDGLRSHGRPLEPPEQSRP
ncbi:MAG: peroxidase [Acidobacteria bacterium]|nr:peroxidase [Acidobacteriota bacterium]